MLDPIKPYADLIRLGLAVLFGIALLCAGGVAGYKWASNGSVEALAAKDQRITSLERSLGDFVALYDRVDAAAKAQIETAKELAKAADVAAKAAQRGEASAAKAADEFERRWQQALRKPDCAALRAMNVEAVCGVPLR